MQRDQQPKTRRKPPQPVKPSGVKEMLYELGYRCSGFHSAPSSVTRSVYRKERLRVLGETMDQPYWSVQRLDGAGVEWYVDIPIEAGSEILRQFLLGVEVGQ